MEEGKWNNVQKRKTNKTQQNNLGEMQNQLRCEMSDRSLKLFPSRCVGRVLVEVWEDKLTVFLNNLPKEKKDPWAWSTGKEEIEMEICEEAQCQHSQAEHHKMVRTLKNNYQLLLKECYDYKWDLRWKNEDLESMEKELQQAKAEAKQCPEMELALDGKNPALEGLEKDLVQERANTEELRITLTNVMQRHLHERMDAMKAVKLMEDSHKARLDASMAEIETLKTAQKSEDQCLLLQQERNSLLEEKQKHGKVVETLHEARNRQKKSHQAALKEAKQQFESAHVQWQEEKASLLQETEALRKTLLNKEQGSKNKKKSKTSELEKSSLLQETEAVRKTLQKKEQESKEKERAMTSELEKTQRSLTSCQAQLERQIKECSSQMSALKEAENRLESTQIQWEENKTSLLQETEALKKSLLKKEQESKEKERAKTSELEKTQRSRASYRAQLGEQIKECHTHMAARKEAENRLESTQIQWEENKTSLLQETEVLNKTLQQKEQESEEKERAMMSELDQTQRSLASCQAQLEEQIKECNTHTSALKEAENRLENTQIQLEENKTSLLQETEVLNKTLRQKEQESEEKEKAMTSELEDLKSQVQKKKNKKKWYRRLFHCKN